MIIDLKKTSFDCSQLVLYQVDVCTAAQDAQKVWEACKEAQELQGALELLEAKAAQEIGRFWEFSKALGASGVLEVVKKRSVSNEQLTSEVDHECIMVQYLPSVF